MEDSQVSSTSNRQRSVGQWVLILVVGVVAVLNTWRSWKVVLMGREAFVQAVTETPLSEGRNVALELAGQSTINEGFMLILLGWIAFLLVYKIR